jgi:hypothetical protein
MEQYTVKGREVFSARGKLVATITDDGGIVMAPGMAGAHKRGVEEFLAQGAAKEPPPPMPEIEEAEVAPESEKTPEQSGEEPAPVETAGYIVSTIPEDRLPPFSKELGVNTPGFAEFVEKNRLSAEQVAALVKRLATR